MGVIDREVRETTRVAFGSFEYNELNRCLSLAIVGSNLRERERERERENIDESVFRMPILPMQSITNKHSGFFSSLFNTFNHSQ